VILCVAGNPSVDRLIEVEALAAGEIHRPTSLDQGLRTGAA
jgi:hypothetical protein